MPYRNLTRERNIPVLRLKKPDRTRWDDRKLDHVRPYLDEAEAEGRFGVVAIVTGKEFQWVWSGRSRSERSGFSFPNADRPVFGALLRTIVAGQTG